MMYMHYCKPCHRVHMLNGHKMACPKCGGSITELRIPYMEYVSMDMNERETFKAKCADPEQLKELSTTYRMYKYSKWYKELQAQNKHNLPITTLLAAMNHSSAENCSIEKLS